MNKLILSTAIIALNAITAHAADIPVKATAKATASVSNWDGGYIGGYLGAQQGKSNTGVDGWTDKNYVQKECKYDGPVLEIAKGFGDYCGNSWGPKQYTTTTYPAASASGNVIGVTFGAYGGYNKQLTQIIVAGLELDGGWSGARDYVQVYAVSASHKMPWNANLTARLGVLVTPDTLLYAKGGLAIQNQKSTLVGPSGSASADQTKAGWTAGAGIEHKITQRLSARVEGLFTKVSDQTIVIPGASSTLNGGSWNAKAGLAWSFN